MSLVRLAQLSGIALVLTFLLLIVAVYAFQRRLLYFPSHRDAAGNGGETFVAWREGGNFLGYVRTAARPKEALLFFHGNAGEAIDRHWVKEVVPASTTIYLAEYPGFGARAGSPNETDIFKAALEAFDAAAAQKLPVVVAGESLGTGVAAYVASRRPLQRLFLISPYSRMTDVAAQHYSWLPVSWLLKDRFDSESNLKNVRVPLAILHGESDDVIPLALARRLFEGYGGAKTLVTVPGAGHNDVVYSLMVSPVAAPLRKFLAEAP